MMSAAGSTLRPGEKERIGGSSLEGSTEMQTRGDARSGPNATPHTRDAWRGRNVTERLAEMKGIFVRHEGVQFVEKFLEQELLLREAEQQASGALLTALPGAGKTWLLKHLQRMYPVVETPTLTTLQMVCFKVPKAPTTKSMGTALLKAMRDPMADYGDSDEKVERIGALLRKTGVRIVAIDDFQDVPAKRRERGVQAISFWIRDLCDLPFPGVVLAVGTAEAEQVRDNNDQIKRRMTATLNLPEFGIASKDQVRRFRSLLSQIDAALPLAEDSGLSQPDVAARLYLATHGLMSYLMKLLLRSLVRTVQRGAEHMELQDLEAGFGDLHQVSALAGNPFAADFDGEQLVRPGQVFSHLRRTDDHGQNATG